jgi:hypothetical protein
LGIYDLDEAYLLRQTPVSQAIYFVHHDPTIFPEPEKFDPERWIRASNDGTNLKKYMVSFNKGSRQCLGMKYVPIICKSHSSLLTLYSSLAYAEMYLTLAMFARNFNVDLVNTTEDNIRLGRDMALPYPYEGRFSVRARVTGIISY